MNSDTTFKTSTTSSADSVALGQRLGKLLTGGEVIELSSDLGGGKTTMAGGIARGLGYDGDIVSPTFTISRVYDLPDGNQLHHFDFYRLDPDDVTSHELAEAAADPKAITLIEWAGQVGVRLPEDRMKIELSATSQTDRDITISGRGMYTKIVEALKS